MASDECFVIKRGRRSSKTRKILPAKQAMPAAGEARRRRSSPQAKLAAGEARYAISDIYGA